MDEEKRKGSREAREERGKGKRQKRKRHATQRAQRQGDHRGARKGKSEKRQHGDSSVLGVPLCLLFSVRRRLFGVGVLAADLVGELEHRPEGSGVNSCCDTAFG